ncbi:hypothetical protein [Desulfosudis oleivorans]|uniref:Uncharacterized protein n=1 Tax=Desulfosudis oleivorans (strain DSM 6200 / JCM 39069 / Hxd3) TaxID=96561 RepID=A9A0J6_DESOH|nr:hypothetical protein [Desulfosudis oleivorans]ABW67496.1 hypothetical protein Dole_1692 [Desulfosudis oleivorans Hxd3]
MVVALREIEVFALGHITSDAVGLFTRYLSGNESFVFDGSHPPKSMGMHSFTYNYPELSSAHFWLFSVTMAVFKEAVQSAGPGFVEQIFHELTVGLLGLDLGGTLPAPRLYAEPIFCPGHPISGRV